MALPLIGPALGAAEQGGVELYLRPGGVSGRIGNIARPIMLLPALAELSTSDRNFWIAVALAGGTLFYLIIRQGKKKKDPLQQPLQARSFSQQRHTERQMESLLVELSEMTRAITAQLDTRSAKLQLLIQEADEKIAALQRLGAGPSTGNARPFEESVPSFPPRLRPPTGESPTSHDEPERPTARYQMPADHPHDTIYALADQGAAAPDIARQLNRPRGEVELILALRSHH